MVHSGTIFCTVAYSQYQILRYGPQRGTRFCALSTAWNQILRHGPQRKTRLCAIAHSGERDSETRPQRGTRFCPSSAEPDTAPWTTGRTRSCTMAHSGNADSASRPTARTIGTDDTIHKADTNSKISYCKCLALTIRPTSLKGGGDITRGPRRILLIKEIQRRRISRKCPFIDEALD
jgi:hypothetical protein